MKMKKILFSRAIKKMIMSVIYRSPNLNNNEFGLLNDVNKGEPFLSVITEYFNARSWWANDISTTDGSKF